MKEVETMKREFLTELGLEKDVVDKIMSENGADIENAKKSVAGLQDELKEKEKTIADLTETIKGFESTDDTVKELQGKIEEYEKAEKERKQAEKDREQDAILTQNILEVIGEKQFVNDYTKDSIIAQVKSELAKVENKGKGASEIFETLTKDVEGIFKNPQQEQLVIEQAGNPNDKELDDAFVRQVMGLPPKTN